MDWKFKKNLVLIRQFRFRIPIKTKTLTILELTLNLIHCLF